jgi:hypothetical protein
LECSRDHANEIFELESLIERLCLSWDCGFVFGGGACLWLRHEDVNSIDGQREDNLKEDEIVRGELREIQGKYIVF